ncbi:hypothetical protein G7078_02790 [Sphingomonas sinipercae]|uniref:Uncharacterized protein n=1 Tax=Sphingomonas sinipercae TaxID=2714944 RepID=A0A6G7ZLP1_9SPHN|nr:FG-GAP-like repeat-containing protein [Sphingomonas sinipercae]QIL01816.1 hypothetical protein G7078_02790 [Sphingomonas sinipercae]
MNELSSVSATQPARTLGSDAPLSTESPVTETLLGTVNGQSYYLVATENLGWMSGIGQLGYVNTLNASRQIHTETVVDGIDRYYDYSADYARWDYDIVRVDSNGQRTVVLADMEYFDVTQGQLGSALHVFFWDASNREDNATRITEFARDVGYWAPVSGRSVQTDFGAGIWHLDLTSGTVELFGDAWSVSRYDDSRVTIYVDNDPADRVSEWDPDAPFGGTWVETGWEPTQFIYNVNGANLFTASPNEVNFNALSTAQLGLINSNANLYQALAGDDIVRLPDQAGYNLGPVMWNPLRTFYGNSGNDRITGGTGADLIDGGADNDRLQGGAGSDTLTGGSGRDTFYFEVGRDILANGAGGTDKITDFNAGFDQTLRFDQAPGFFDNPNLDKIRIVPLDGSAGNALTFIGSSQFTGTRPEIAFEWDVQGAVTHILIDYNGDGQKDHQIEIDGLFIMKEVPGEPGSFYGLEAPPNPQVIYLDFDHAARAPTPTVQGLDWNGDGIGSSVDLSLTRQQQIVAETQQIFANSLIPILVTNIQPDAVTLTHSTTVRFSDFFSPSPSDPNSYAYQLTTGSLLGWAYEGVDQFNQSSQNEVGVFIGDQNNLRLIAEVIAHEAGHSFGLRHINPFPGNTSEVMDYDWATDPTGYRWFWDMPAAVTDQGLVNTLYTHNNAYHLLRWALGYTHEEIVQERGLEPGTWDRDYLGQTWKLELSSILSEGLDLAKIVIFRLGEDGGQGDLFSSTDPIYVTPGQPISLELPVGGTFRIVGYANADDTVASYIIGTATTTGPDVTFTSPGELSIGGTIYLISPDGSVTGVAGSFTTVIEQVGHVPAHLDSTMHPQNLTDFNGDGIADVLWRSDTGVITTWLGQADGTFIDNSANTGQAIPLDWNIVGTGDYNGDGLGDIMWRSDAGVMTQWLGQLDGTFRDNFAKTGQVIPLDWNVIGTGDFNGDGLGDLIWRSDAGVITEWLGNLDGSFRDNFAGTGQHIPLNWTIDGMGDFNGDGLEDLIWRSDAGVITEWLGQNDGSFKDNFAGTGQTIPTNWQIVGVGDFNADGYADILWQSTAGTLTNWLGNPDGSFTDNFVNTGQVIPQGWELVGVGDLNGDGRDDILWRTGPDSVETWFGQDNGGFTGGSSGTLAAAHAAGAGTNGDLFYLG